MPRYVALLASINVGGNQVKMADLKTALEGRGLENVSTVTASGNVIFDHPRAADSALAKLIGDCVQETFGFRTFAAVRTADELRDAVRESPFRAESQDKFVHVHFLEKDLDKEAYNRLLTAHQGKGEEKFAPGKAHVHIDFVGGVGISKVTRPFLEKHLGAMGTARNLRSLERIIDAMEKRT